MMEFSHRHSVGLRGRCSVTAGAVFLLALVWVLTSGPFLLMLLGASVLHEGGHLAACQLCHVSVRGLRITICGAELRLEGYPTPAKQLIIALSGPLASLLITLLTLFLFPGTEQAAVFAGLNLIAGLFNLLPVEPLDGGRALTALCSLLSLGAETIHALDLVTTALLVLLLLPGALLSYQGNTSLLFLALWLLSGRIRKNDCNS